MYTILYEGDMGVTETIQIKADNLIDCIKKFNILLGNDAAWQNRAIEWTYKSSDKNEQL